jgi:hypothetical protein
MREGSNAWDPAGAILLGAAVGGAVAFVCFTPAGRRLLNGLDRALDEAFDQMGRLQEAANKVHLAMDEGRRTFDAIERAADPIGPTREPGRFR